MVVTVAEQCEQKIMDIRELEKQGIKSVIFCTRSSNYCTMLWPFCFYSSILSLLRLYHQQNETWFVDKYQLVMESDSEWFLLGRRDCEPKYSRSSSVSKA